MTIVRTTFESPIAPINVAAGDDAVVAIEMLTPPDLFQAELERRLHTTIDSIRPASTTRAARLIDLAIGQLEAYFDGGSRTFDLPIDLRDRPSWDVAVFDGVRSIGWGEVSTYGRVARRIGRPGAARAVGGAVGRNPIGIVIPCHRVIAGDGTIGGYGGGWWGGRERLLTLKRDLLELEGIDLPVRHFADDDARIAMPDRRSGTYTSA